MSGSRSLNFLQDGSKPKRQSSLPSSYPSYYVPPIILHLEGTHLDELLARCCANSAAHTGSTIPHHHHLAVVCPHAPTFVHVSASIRSLSPPYWGQLLVQRTNPTVLRTRNAIHRRKPEALDHPSVHSDPVPTRDIDGSQNLIEGSGRPPIRYLTVSLRENSKIMTAVQTVPGSPPDLTDSRSSKSSSYGSHFSEPDDLATENTHFENIGLEDDQSAPRGDPGAPTPVAQPSKIGHVQYYAAQNSSLPELRTTKSQRRNSPGSPRTRKGFPASSVTTIAESRSPRSISPANRIPRSTSTTSLTYATSPRPSIATTSRQNSWVRRKTVTELEAEYADSDDDLPDDASLWNVPISPFFSNHSPLSSTRGSPERRASVKSPQPIPLDHAKSAPQVPQPRKSSLGQPLPRRRLMSRASTTNLSKSHPTSPHAPIPLSRTGRAKSWNLAMAELSTEARVISQNLEAHAEASLGSTTDLRKPSASHRSFAPSAIQLPPIQRGPLDFMPVSKEKEAVLSRTRPSWLPPKDPKEERRHLKEYQKMMAASLEAERKQSSRVQAMETANTETNARLNRIWEFYVQPTTDLASIDPRVNALCWRGITPRLRGQVWQRRIGNSLGLSATTFEKALARAQEVKSMEDQSLSRQERVMRAGLTDIERDVETAFPELNMFQRDGPLWQGVVDVCEAHVCYRSDVGYVYGIQLIAALLLLQVSDPAETFILMENCLNHPVPLAFQTDDPPATQRTYQKVTAMLGIKFPQLYDYLFDIPENGGLGFTANEIFEPMLRTLFCNGLDVDRLCRVWDVWMFEGDRTLIRAAVAVLGSLQSQIFQIEGDLHLKRRNIQEMLGWGPFNRTIEGGCWRFAGGEELFVDEIRTAGKLDYTGR